jgi:hypothetical protein
MLARSLMLQVQALSEKAQEGLFQYPPPEVTSEGYAEGAERRL